LRVVLDASPLADGRANAGIGRYVAQLGDALRRRGDLDVRMVRPSRPPLRESWAVRWLHAQPRLAVAAISQRPQLMHGMASDPIAVWPLRRQVVTVHDVIPWEPGRVPSHTWTARYLALQRRRFRHCAAVIAVSNVVAAEAAEALRVDEGRIHVIAEGVGSEFQPQPAQTDEQLRRKAGVGATGYILWVGSLRAHDPRKSLDTLLDAFAAACASDGPRLVLAGASGAESRRLEAATAARGITPVLTGYVDDATLAALYRGAVALVLPSLHEGFGLPVLEAMASGCPVIVSAAGNLPHLVGDAGIVVPAAEEGALTEALRSVVANHEMRRRLSAAGIHRAAGYSWERAAEQTAVVYHSVVR
jgi:glycosyltransferase involved in cell wall biosynthesis